MVRPVLMLIPPMGHDSQFYAPLRDALYSLTGDELQLLTPDYPAMESLTPLNVEEVLDYLANYFMDYLLSATDDIVEEGSYHSCSIVIGGVSLGATLSIRINHLMGCTPTRVLLMASGGLKVSRARRETIQGAIDLHSAADFVLKSMAIDAATCADSSFPIQFQQFTPAIEDYWNHQADMLRSLVANAERADCFVKMTRAALGVDFEHHMTEESSNYSIIWSEQDKVFSRRMYRKFQQFAHQARFHLLDNIGHYAPLEDPQRIAHLITQELMH